MGIPGLLDNSSNTPYYDWFEDNTPPVQQTSSSNASSTDATGTSGASTSNDAWTQQRFQSLFGSPGTPDQLVALEPQLNAQGIKVLRNAAGVAGKIQLPDGSIVDVINSAGAGGKGFQWLTGDSGSGGGSGSNLAGGYAIFKAPTLKDLYASPGYQARLAEGLQGVQRSAAARGTLLTGGTLKALDQYGQNFASSEYDKLFNQRLAGNAQTSGNLLRLAELGKPQ